MRSHTHTHTHTHTIFWELVAGYNRQGGTPIKMMCSCVCARAGVCVGKDMSMCAHNVSFALKNGLGLRGSGAHIFYPVTITVPKTALPLPTGPTARFSPTLPRCHVRLGAPLRILTPSFTKWFAAAFEPRLDVPPSNREHHGPCAGPNPPPINPCPLCPEGSSRTA